MDRTSAFVRSPPGRCALLLSCVCTLAACRSAPHNLHSVPVVDLVQQFDAAEIRPVRGRFQRARRTLAGVARATIVTPAASRMIWTSVLPRRAVLRTFVGVLPATGAAAIRYRIGVSDHRIYEVLATREVTSDETGALGWIEMEADLSLYAGSKLSLFYQPEGREWRLVLSTDHLSGSAEALWGAPAVLADSAAARLYQERYAGSASVSQ